MWRDRVALSILITRNTNSEPSHGLDRQGGGCRIGQHQVRHRASGADIRCVSFPSVAYPSSDGLPSWPSGDRRKTTFIPIGALFYEVGPEVGAGRRHVPCQATPRRVHRVARVHGAAARGARHDEGQPHRPAGGRPAGGVLRGQEGRAGEGHDRQARRGRRQGGDGSQGAGRRAAAGRAGALRQRSPEDGRDRQGAEPDHRPGLPDLRLAGCPGHAAGAEAEPLDQPRHVRRAAPDRACRDHQGHRHALPGLRRHRPGAAHGQAAGDLPEALRHEAPDAAGGVGGRPGRVEHEGVARGAAQPAEHHPRRRWRVPLPQGGQGSVPEAPDPRGEGADVRQRARVFSWPGRTTPAASWRQSESARPASMEVLRNKCLKEMMR